MSRHGHVWFGVVAALLLAAPGIGFGQPAETVPGLSLADLQTRLKRAQSETELAPQVKQEVIEIYEAAIERYEIADEAAAASKNFQQRIDSIPDDLVEARKKLALLPEQSTFVVAPDMELAALERSLDDRRNQIEAPEHGLRARVEAIKKELAGRKSRLEAIARDLAEIDERLATIQELLDSPDDPGEPREMTAARQALLLTRRKRANDERAALRAEQAWCESDAGAELLKVQRDVAARELALVEAEVQVLRAAVNQRRGSEADQRVRAAQLTVDRASPRVKSIAEKNLELAVEGRDLSVALRGTNQQVDETRSSFNALKARFEQSRKMVEAVGLTESIGLLLRQQRAELGDTRDLYSRMALRSGTVRQTRMRLFQIEAELTTLADLDAAAIQTALELTSEESPAQPAATAGSATSAAPATQPLVDELKPLLEQRRDLLEQLNADNETHFEKLVLLDNDERKLLDETKQYADFIDARVLWIRTGGMYSGTHVARSITETRWLVDRANWRKVADALQGSFQHEPLPYVIMIVALLLWVGLRWTLRRQLRLLGATAANESCRDLSPTLKAAALTILLAAVLPACLTFIGWRLDQSTSSSSFVHAVSLGLLRAARLAVPLELLRLLVQRGGLADQHFEWTHAAVVRLRRQLYWFVPLGVLLIAIVGMVEGTSNEQRLDTLGRTSYLAFVGLVALFGMVAFVRNPQVATPSVLETPDLPHARRDQSPPVDSEVWMNRLVRVGRLLAVAVPSGLFCLCWTGYFYTALQLTWRLLATVWLVMGLVLLRGLVRRWITLERRRMAIKQAEELQAIAGAGKQPGSESHSPFLFPRWNWPDFRLNLTQIVTQVRSLLDTGLLTIAAVGLWFVWADVTPALNILDRFPLWQTTVNEVVPAEDSADGSEVRVVQRPKAITAANLGMAILLLAIATVASRNIPGLVEVILLEHLSVDAGARFATTCLVRYVIFITGVVMAFNQIGVGWNSVQWLVAAASVGLGFGLQEIFANFVSGIILLFERPIRVGDVITIGDTTGTVSRIRFRATTIVDGDRKELVVPNKSFITGNLLNWTLSDSINRVTIRVGVAYNSDPNRVRELLLKIASEHPLLLKNPAPQASLEGLGESALQFVLCAFLPTLKDRQKATHELNTIIHDRFRASGIEIPFPQHEVSVQFKHPLPPAVMPNTGLHASLETALQRAGVNV